ncbi:hypothetical protein JCM3775_000418 [Rhodotorula graminis]
MRTSSTRGSPARRARLRLSSALVLAVAGLASFALGFFPVKPLLPGFSSRQTYEDECASPSGPGELRSDAFSRLAFVVVDALRSDFALGPESRMSFLASLVVDGHALPYTAVAQAPTVTLPRLKALTTGSNPTFVDALLNLAEETSSSAALENVDSWLRQLVLSVDDGGAPKKVAFAGDDTWLRLFPQTWFSWHEGVSSFFVSDTVTVDSNVTRHLDALLGPPRAPVAHPVAPSTEWDVLILHYLGLDHVGHLEGPASPLMAPKQVEMDKVVERVYRYLERRDEADGQRSLLVLVGDHGMTEGGNHGGSTEAETSAALVLAAPSLRLDERKLPVRHESPYKHFEVVQQIDLVPTLSVLFDLGMPRNSIGKLVRSAVQALRPAAFLGGLQSNMRQVGAVLAASSSSAMDWTLSKTVPEGRWTSFGALADEGSFEEQAEFLAVAQARLLASSSSYHLRPLFLGLAILVLASFVTLMHVRRIWSVETHRARLAVAVAVLVFLGSLFATSFIEEEHEIWYFLSATALLVSTPRSDLNSTDRLSLVGAAASVRLLRSWAHNGQKNVSNVSIAAYLATSPRLTSALVSLTYVLVSVLAVVTLALDSRVIARQRLPPAALLRRAALLAISAVIVVAQSVVGSAMHLSTLLVVGDEPSALWRVLEQLELADQVSLARAGYGLAAGGWLWWRVSLRVQTSKTVPMIHLSLLLMSVTRPTNVPLFLAFYVQHVALGRLASKPSASPAVLALLVAALQSSTFFGLGGSNSLATADLSQAYNGLRSFSLTLVTLLAFLSNFSGPIFLSLSLHTLPPVLRPLVLDYLSAFHVVALTALAASATHFREHLFALTVFAPAVLYRAGWFVWVQVGTNLGLSRLLLG